MPGQLPAAPSFRPAKYHHSVQPSVGEMDCLSNTSRFVALMELVRRARFGTRTTEFPSIGSCLIPAYCSSGIASQRKNGNVVLSVQSDRAVSRRLRERTPDLRVREQSRPTTRCWAWRSAELFDHVAQCAPHPHISVLVGSTWFRTASHGAAGTSRRRAGSSGSAHGSSTGSTHGSSTHGRAADGSATHGGPAHGRTAHGGTAHGRTCPSFRRTAYGRDTTRRFAALRGAARRSSTTPGRRPPCRARRAAFCSAPRRCASHRSSPRVR